MNDNQDEYKAYQRRLLLDKIIYRLVFVFTIALIGFSIWYAYENMQASKASKSLASEVLPTDIGGSQKQPLPDFIIDKVQPDELEQLKP